MGKESTRCKVRDDSACEQNGESRCFRVNLRQPQGQLCRLSLLLLLLPVVMAAVPTSLAPSSAVPGVLQGARPGWLGCATFWARFSPGAAGQVLVGLSPFPTERAEVPQGREGEGRADGAVRMAAVAAGRAGRVSRLSWAVGTGLTLLSRHSNEAPCGY